MSGETDSLAAANSRRFAAFISYSHADAAIAAKLQRKLEQYRLPRHIARDRAGGDADLGPVFRDREDLAAAPSLSDAIRDGLARAEALIVICSPAARDSRWVADEIALFRELHPDRPVLAALVKGEPAISFPAALTAGGIEPLAADLRKEADGLSLGFLKIVAGVAGVPLDTLVQRDAQRRIRRVTWITLGALAAMLVMAVMTTLALQARNEAARQRASAEGLVEYMLTDLREKLKGVGRLDVMEGVNRRAMEHYRRQGDLSDLPADALERRARILHAMGEDDEREGNMAQAVQKFAEARRTTVALLSKDPNNPDRIFADAQSSYWLGFAAWKRRDRRAASLHWDNYLKAAITLLRVDRNNRRSNLEASYATVNLCALNFRDRYNLKAAANHCGAAIEQALLALDKMPNDPASQDALANAYGWLADVRIASGNPQAALSARETELQTLDQMLARDPQNAAIRMRRSICRMGQGRALYLMGNTASAARVLASAVGEMEKSWARDLSDQSIATQLLRAKVQLWEAEHASLSSRAGETRRSALALLKIVEGRDAISAFEKNAIERRLQKGGNTK